jgi:hypothetical protein
VVEALPLNLQGSDARMGWKEDRGCKDSGGQSFGREYRARSICWYGSEK